MTRRSPDFYQPFVVSWNYNLVKSAVISLDQHIVVSIKYSDFYQPFVVSWNYNLVKSAVISLD